MWRRLLAGLRRASPIGGRSARSPIRLHVRPSNSTKTLVAAKKLERDRAQERLLARFAALEQRVAAHRSARRTSRSAGCSAAASSDEPVKGLYVHGDVGRGKTMLMDLFFEASPVVRKRRAHFHEFMADVHERVRVFRQKLKDGEFEGEDAIRLAAGEIAEESWLLCFDEFHVTDIADAMILGRLFARLFELGVVVVATSNVAPAELYKDGLNRALFLPFIAMIEQHMEVLELKARTDFRLEKLAGQKVWFVPADDEATDALDRGVAAAGRQRQRHAAGAFGEGPAAARAARRHGRGAVLLP